MCMVSAIGDNFKDTFPQKYPGIFPKDWGNPAPNIQPFGQPTFQTGVSQAEFDALKKEVQELKKLLKAAKKFDKLTNQPHCEVEDKVKLIKDIAKLVGVDLGDVLD